jgi:hypothetical protein
MNTISIEPICEICDIELFENDKNLHKTLIEEGYTNEHSAPNCTCCWRNIMNEMIEMSNITKDWDEGLYIVEKFIFEEQPEEQDLTPFYIIKTWKNDIYDGWYENPKGVKFWNTEEEALVWFYALENTTKAELIKIDPTSYDRETILETTDKENFCFYCYEIESKYSSVDIILEDDKGCCEKCYKVGIGAGAF